MNRFLGLSEADRRKITQRIGLTEKDLFASVKRATFLEDWPSEREEVLRNRFRILERSPEERLTGGGIGPFPIPAVVDAMASRSEFVTAYTPYQPEVSQGTLEVIFEFQTRVCDMTGLEISNAGLYDGSTAVAEAISMAAAVTKRREVLLARTVSPRIREVVRTLLAGRGFHFREVSFDRESGILKEVGDEATPSEETACLVIQSPNAFGLFESRGREWFAAAREVGAVPIQIFHPLAVFVSEKPASSGAAIAVAEGQPLGIPLSGGGPFLGMIAAEERFLRRMPGRIVGETVDANGRRALVLTLQAREQHIRRERATSNICSNQALMALRATLFCAALEWEGITDFARRLSDLANDKARAEAIFPGRVFNEYAVKGNRGLPLDYPELGAISVVGVGTECDE